MAEWNSLLANNPGVIGSGVQTSMYAGAEQAQKAHEALYAQQLKQTTEALVARSIDDRGNFDQDRFMALARQTPFGAAALSKGLELVGAQWNTAQAAAKAGTSLNARGVDPSKVFPESSWRYAPPNAPMGAQAPVTSDTDPRAARAGAGWARQPVKAPIKQSSSLAPATVDTTGFTTPDMLQGGSGYSAKTTTVTGQGQNATSGDIATANPSALEGPGPSAADIDKAYEETAPKHSALYNIQHMDAGKDMGGAPGGGMQMPEIPDLSKMDPNAIKAIANQMRNSGQYRGNDIPGPQMQAAYAAKVKADWDALAAREPKASMYIGADGEIDIGAFQKEHAKWVSDAKVFKNALAGKTNEAYNEGLSQKTTKLGHVQAGQGIQRAASPLDQVAAAHAEGYKNVNTENLTAFNEHVAEGLRLDQAMKQLTHLAAVAGTMKPDAFNVEIQSIRNAIEQSEALSTEGGRAAFDNSIRSNKSFGSIVDANHGRSIGDLLTALVAHGAASNNHETVAELLKGAITSVKKSGKWAGDENMYKGGWSKKPPRGDKGPRGKKVGEKNAKGQTWTGIRWIP